MLQPITSSHGLGCLVNNGGTANLTGLTAVRPRMMMDMFSVNVVGPLMLTKARIGCHLWCQYKLRRIIGIIESQFSNLT